MSGPHFPDSQPGRAAFVDGGSPRILIGNKSEHWARWSADLNDFGATVDRATEGNIKFPKGSGVSLNAIWALEAAARAEVVLGRSRSGAISAPTTAARRFG